MKNFALKTIIFTLLFLIISCNKEPIDEPINNFGIEDMNMKMNIKATGFDEWGFNWQAQQFNGYLINMMLGDTFFEGWPHYRQHVYNGEGIEFWNMLVSNYDYFPYLMPFELLETKLNAKWNEGIISKEGVYPVTWVDSDGWIVFKYSGKDGNKTWSHSRKLISSRSTDKLVDGIWYNEMDQEIGFESMYWPELIVVQVNNTGDIPPFFYDEYNTPWGSGYGHYKN